MVKKVCISLPAESLGQLAWLSRHVLLASDSATFSGLIQQVISLAYYKCQNNK